MEKDITNINRAIEFIRKYMSDDYLTDENIEIARQALIKIGEMDIRDTARILAEKALIINKLLHSGKIITTTTTSQGEWITYDPGQLISYDTYQHNYMRLE